MASWVHVQGLVNISVMGRTQPETRYILDTVLIHLPDMAGSEGGLKVHVVQCDGTSTSCNYDEFGNPIVDNHWRLIGGREWREIQSNYFLVLEAALRNAEFETAYRELQNYLCRLAKRVQIERLNVDIWGHTSTWDWKRARIDNAKPYYDMWEHPSWSDENSKNWCEYLMWDREDIPECYQ